MKKVKVIMVRIYLTEAEEAVKTVIKYLKDDVKVRGISVFRAIQGYGEMGEHTSSWIDLSLDLPITIEFFDHEDKVKPALDHLSHIVKPEHVVFWEASANDNGK
ncbi:MAG: hypothetical protein COZ46_00990 [Verrucomicrobia bacterium CG_4_10_14_3_um_filter_43_23]|nr:MAG: hypothetical protein COX01_03635 [Verrucomicrobia bacterium CG22_combo_CG10-13_8_21_14_all_43_17]PIX58998.1 MAG: hypothetical protein COZ46_00990 [Verrucomicrobia bacterium CG_4_10_14_3_um_filter_43_23]PIY63119.1 MAG: hypothetical protein COY94_00380 [Verrucomicrobia bacterium CG_4_10_14_0_8_um_filter_43_34]